MWVTFFWVGRISLTMPGSSNHRTFILVVDDDPQVLKLMGDVLTTAGYRVLLARGGWQAVEVFEAQGSAPELLVTDVIMPDLTGPVLASRLLKAAPQMKVLFISGYHDTELVQRFVTQQGFALLPKPFTPEGLLRTVEESLGA
jgi:two-component system, cell cycle sensor histidine kinase and response regulator CckA